MSNFPDFFANHTVLVLLFVLVLSSWLIFEVYSRGKTISAHELVQLMNAESIVLLDIRALNLFQRQHIASSYNIPQDNRLAAIDKLLQNNPASKVVMVNESGMVPIALTQHIQKKKFVVFSLKGGIMQWIQENLPVINAQQHKHNNTNKKVLSNKRKK
jgi:rhodanese-related sulfurtransferase